MSARDLMRERHILSEALRGLLEVGCWTNEGTKEYIREHMLPNVVADWTPSERRES
ncbi:hypothetical protein [Streptomyces sp. ITFR-6]|uniref:hypothetical protein n=1 Tax=Streptomyces sp. ITFR-6 TaxID=3075197 RepID=UPI00288BA6C5|nr:hypothetical protein [Streptomyces sp. ITFR-6]WNI28639.1 hypothetical protein RLT59_07435 [Streptomyces sp. ITFR-6]